MTATFAPSPWSAPAVAARTAWRFGRRLEDSAVQGMLMLTFITLRLMKGHFTPERHFGFEGAAWYWHFVDVVWLGLYFLVYWL